MSARHALFLVFAATRVLTAQTTPPVPRQAADTNASPSRKVEKKAPAGQQPAAAIPSVVPSPSVPGGSRQNTANQNKGDDNQKTVTISQFPSVSVERDWVDYALVVFNFGLVLIGFFGVRAAICTLGTIEKQAGLMETQIQDARKSNADNAKGVQASIAEAVRSARAMEVVAGSMAVNAESVKTSVGISREIADTQKLVTELQSRPYLSALFNAAIFQDAAHIFRSPNCAT